MPTADSVKLIECPRDAWQGLKGQIPAELKTNYLQALISTGFKHIDAVSFVSPNAVPQMSDSEEVLKELDPHRRRAPLRPSDGTPRSRRGGHLRRVGYDMQANRDSQARIRSHARTRRSSSAPTRT